MGRAGTHGGIYHTVSDDRTERIRVSEPHYEPFRPFSRSSSSVTTTVSTTVTSYVITIMITVGFVTLTTGTYVTTTKVTIALVTLFESRPRVPFLRTKRTETKTVKELLGRLGHTKTDSLSLNQRQRTVVLESDCVTLTLVKYEKKVEIGKRNKNKKSIIIRLTKKCLPVLNNS